MTVYCVRHDLMNLRMSRNWCGVVRSGPVGLCARATSGGETFWLRESYLLMIEERGKLYDGLERLADLCRSCEDLSEQHSKPRRVRSEGAGTFGASGEREGTRDVDCFK